ncbi:hypothetical protein V6G44_002435 [Burkholderia multivorans]|uniref:polymorphic toxin type 15 domain-containing protein n=1 Tax=Burkholderia multivorans TaxID=87883 RepID=UPI000D001753|nr:polymorphic toxin type 15 domain-containing protein [Burkholderia multivorans]MCL4626168.1 polymorphic toxin type 15 domain-containing protein [Burkholderia multivorans]MCO1381564.1 polymorphic toxin type 15 domain-containing protein [Burkholderia multivorans]MCO1386731.1 polymorphic toxin type 15 domain-containing protein [Burkholderia multivorans]MCO1401705.1 polymorphic toxin type 15 domain-containing protein [Burkholderia multivorans]MDN7398571.1 polymorphic toxin type 15 domain-contain
MRYYGFLVQAMPRSQFGQLPAAMASGNCRPRPAVQQAAKEAEEAKKAQAEAERLRKLKEEGEAAEKGKDGLKVKLSRMKEHLVKCFKKNAKGDPKEYDRQLLEQEKGLNDLSVMEHLEGRARYQEIGRAGTGAAQEQARAKYSRELCWMPVSREQSAASRGCFTRTKSVTWCGF